MRSLDVIAVVEAGLMSALVDPEVFSVSHLWLGVRTGRAVGARGRPGRQSGHVEVGLLLAVALVVLLVTVAVVLVIMLRLVLVMILWLMVVSVVIVVTHMIVVISQPLLLLLVEALVVTLAMVRHQTSLASLVVSYTRLESLLLSHSERR